MVTNQVGLFVTPASPLPPFLFSSFLYYTAAQALLYPFAKELKQQL